MNRGPHRPFERLNSVKIVVITYSMWLLSCYWDYPELCRLDYFVVSFLVLELLLYGYTMLLVFNELNSSLKKMY